MRVPVDGTELGDVAVYRTLCVAVKEGGQVQVRLARIASLSPRTSRDLSPYPGCKHVCTETPRAMFLPAIRRHSRNRCRIW